MSTSKHLSNLLKTSKEIPFDDSSRFVIMSDCHRGVGNWGDNFMHNQNLFFAALSFYYENGYTYIELGDGDELWENRKIEDIISTHSDAFWLMSLFYREGRFHMLYGNHDIAKRDHSYANKTCGSYFCNSTNSKLPLFPGIKVTESIVLNNLDYGKKILLIHGHQGDFINDTMWRASRFLVRYLWSPLELIGIRDPTSASKNSMKTIAVEKRLKEWAENENQMIIAGHTHRTVFPKVGEPLYFNDGSCVHPRCITAIEIRNGMISLVKWAVMTRPDRSLFVGREVLEPPVRLIDYWNETKAD